MFGFYRATHVHSAVYMPLHDTLCPSQTCVQSKRLNRSSWFWQRGYSRFILTLCYNGIRVSLSSKIRVLTPGTLSQTLNLAAIFLDFFATTRRLPPSVINLVLPSEVYHTSRPRLFTIHLPWRRASRGSSATAETIGTDGTATACRTMTFKSVTASYLWNTIFGVHNDTVITQ